MRGDVLEEVDWPMLRQEVRGLGGAADYGAIAAVG